jgi:phage shock protein PspC (stress-responsive transcriptional regulator)
MPKQTPPKTDADETPEPPASDGPASAGRTSDSATPPPASAAASGNRFFSWLRSIGITRQPGWIGGVAVGIADRLGIDPLIVRGILIVVAIVGAPATLLYAIAWLLLPDAKGKIHLEELIRGRFDTPMIGIAVLFAISLLPVPQGIWSLGAAYWGQPYWGDSLGRAVWTLVVIGLLIWLVVWFVRRGERNSGSTTSSPATTDDRPDTIPQPSPRPPASTDETATLTAPVAPPAPPSDATTEQLTAWREQQALWKTQYDGYRQQQAAEKYAASRAANARAREERMVRTAAYRAVRERSRSNPLYSAVLIGVALVAGALTALAVSNGEPGALDILVGIGVAIGLLGVGIVINGIRGRRSGGASGVAILLLVPLVFAGVFPQSTNLHYSGDWRLAPVESSGSHSQAFVQGFGDVTIDLRNFLDDPDQQGLTDGAVQVYVASGNVTVLMPALADDFHGGFWLHTSRGTITTDTGVHLTGNHDNSWGTAWSSPSGTVAQELDVQVRSLSGNITIIHESSNGVAQ